MQAKQHYPATSCALSTAPINLSEAERLASLGGGLALAYLGLSMKKGIGLATAGLGAGLIYRGLSGHCHLYSALGRDTADSKPHQPAIPAEHGVRVQHSVLIDCDVRELFSRWRQLTDLPQLFRHLEEVQDLGNGYSRWTARTFTGQRIIWEAKIIDERDNELIAWKSLPGGDIDTSGSIRFAPIGSHTTQVTISLKYNPPGGRVTDYILSWLGQDLGQILTDDLENFKSNMETEAMVHAEI